MGKLFTLNVFLLLVNTSVLSQQYGSLKDPRDSKVYKTVKIGEQVWMAQNLDVSTFNNGDPIPQALSSEEWRQADKNKQPAWCYYWNDKSLSRKYGKLYNWYAVADPRGLAPKGFHIPTDSDWRKLYAFLGGIETAGYKLKNKTGWLDDGNGDNSVGFYGLAAGQRGDLGDCDFVSLGLSSFWWSTTEFKKDYAKVAFLFSYSKMVEHVPFSKGRGFSVRCIKN
jgi:uncharacterized protein (TIGR02145 family)